MLLSYGRDPNASSDTELETLGRLSSMMKHSKHYRKLQVKNANSHLISQEPFSASNMELGDIWRNLAQMDESSPVVRSTKRLRFSEVIEIIEPSLSIADDHGCECCEISEDLGPEVLVQRRNCSSLRALVQTFTQRWPSKKRK